MTRNSLAPLNCSVAKALDVVGEWWSLLIVREAFYGTRRFQDFADRLGIARNILSARLKRLVAEGVLSRTADARNRDVEYRLTAKGDALFPVMIALLQWGDRYVNTEAVPVLLFDSETGDPVAPLEVRTTRGKLLGAHDLRARPGPGADTVLARRLAPRPRVAARSKIV